MIEARGDGRVEEAVTARLHHDWSVVPGTERTVPVDALCVTHGFSPQLELPVAAGCRLRGGAFTDVDDDQRTSVPGVYAAGEITGIAGAPAARTEGLLAGWAAGGGDPGDRAAAALRRRRDRARAFAGRLAAAHPVGAAWPGWLRPDTIVCRCEETDYGTLLHAADGAAAAPRAPSGSVPARPRPLPGPRLRPHGRRTAPRPGGRRRSPPPARRPAHPARRAREPSS
ncbi:FAD-dependent oxidoreductase [Actinomadura luteofluorescens]|uniref:FAD-dependent oxidoreductase n=1 Tax=Actinomadura luteofluorescens TaxID=46163 RepID=UPI00362E63CE